MGPSGQPGKRRILLVEFHSTVLKYNLSGGFFPHLTKNGSARGLSATANLMKSDQGPRPLALAHLILPACV